MTKPLGIYIHIPFCERKCTYCNFNTTDFFDDLAQLYIEAASREIFYWGEFCSQSSEGDRAPVDTIYIGGGTPSIVDARHLENLIASCRAVFDVAQDAEITIEINPGTFDKTKVLQWWEAGINRASVGVQSFLDKELVALSRTHDADQARSTLELLREVGFQNISLDLIAGLPEQTLSDWEFNLREALTIGPEHMSLYMLDLKEGTQLYSQLKRGQRPKPDDDLAAEMYRMISDATQSSGYEHYEISNFARLVPNHTLDTQSPFRSKHNMKYWIGAPFYGMGCGAHSYDGTARWFNVLKTETYIDRVMLEGNAIAERNELANEDRAAEALFMGLRLREGISLAAFRSEYGIDVIKRYGEELPRLAEAGLIELGGDRLVLTPTGRLLSNEVFVSFV